MPQAPAPAPAVVTSPQTEATTRVASARSLAQIIDAQARVAEDQLAALGAQAVDAANELDAVNADLTALQTQVDARRTNRDRIARDAFRLMELPGALVPGDLPEAQRAALEDLRALLAGLRSQRERLAERVAALAELQDSASVKRAAMDRANARAQTLAAAAARGSASTKAAELAVLRSLADEVANSQASLSELIGATLGKATTPGVSTWSLPLQGVITQGFGPTPLALEPAAWYQGAYYPHFHAAIDIAAPYGAPVVAAAAGQVTFVGHLPDGAEIVLITHADGLVSEYAHLDDTFVPPPVKIGQAVKAGDVIGYVGLTGITTGAHLHFAVLRNGEAIDPLSLIATN